MTDVLCSPACDPNLPVNLPANNAPAAPAPAGSLGSDCTAPMFVKLCTPDEFDTTVLCNPVGGASVVVVTAYNVAGVPTSTAYNLDGSPYVGSISALVSCGSATESDPVSWCQTLNPGTPGETKNTLTQWVVKDAAGQPTGVTYWTNFAGAVIAPPAPATVIMGSCGASDTIAVTSVLEEGCANGLGINRRTTTSYKGGIALSSIVDYINTAGAVTPTAPLGWTIGNCATAVETYVEQGCLTTPPCIDLTNVERSVLNGVTVGGVNYPINLPVGWTTDQLAAALNAAIGVSGPAGASVTAASAALGQSDQRVCFSFPNQPTLGVSLDLGLLFHSNNFGAGARTSYSSTNATYNPSGALIDGEYAVTAFNDPALGPNSTAGGLITADASNDPNGRAFITSGGGFGNVLLTDVVPLASGTSVNIEFSVANLNLNNSDPQPEILFIVRDGLFTTNLASYNAGPVPRDGKWHKFSYAFTMPPGFVDITYEMFDNSSFPVNFAIDNVSVGKSRKSNFAALPTGQRIPVEVVKTVDVVTKAVLGTRVYSENGLLEYTRPFANGLQLSVGDCPDLLASVDGSNVTTTIEQGCAGGLAANRRTSFYYKGQVLTGTEVAYVDATGASAALKPAGWTLGACASAGGGGATVQIEVEGVVGCAAGVEVTQWVTFQDGIPTGGVFYTDSAGLLQAIQPVGWTRGACERANPAIIPSVQRQTGAGSIVIPVNARSVTVTVIAGTPTAAIGGGAAVTLPTGISLTWAVDKGGTLGERLSQPFTFAGLAGHDFIVTTTRE